MLLLGGIALFSIRKSSWLILLVVECGNCVLLLVIVVRTLLAQASGCRLTPYVHFRAAGWYSFVGFVLGSGSGADPSACRSSSSARVHTRG